MSNIYRSFARHFFARKPSTESARHARKAFQQRRGFSLSRTVLFFSVMFLFFPLVIVVAYSFNEQRGLVWSNFSLCWYVALFTRSADLWRALKNSFIIAIASSAAATVLGTLASIGTCWYRFKFKRVLKIVSILPMILPEVIIGVSMLIFFAAVNIPMGMMTIFIAHVTFNLPFVYLLVSARLDEFNFSIVEAARDLGATEFQAITKVVIPAIMPGIISGFLMAITMSLEDYVITQLVSGPGSSTLPIYVFAQTRFGVSPVVNALSFMLILGTMLVAFVLRKFLKNIAAAK